MIYYFIRSESGVGRLTRDSDLSTIETLRSESRANHPGDWHSPIYEVPDGTTVAEAPMAIVFADGYDRYLYPDGSIGPME